jgi:D-3-phosphoglycerate dehydrogenase
MSTFRVALTADLTSGIEPGGWMSTPIEEVLEPLPAIEWELLRETPPEVPPGLVRDFDAVISGHPRWTKASFGGLERLVLVARWGAGVDEVDLRAATDADVLVATAPAPANRLAVAESVLAFILALSKHLLAKDRLTRQGRAEDAQQLSGRLVAASVIGIIGFGNTGSALAELLRPLRPARLLAHDPYAPPAAAERPGVELVDLDVLMRESDYVAVMCSLTEETHHLVNAVRLASMKPTAYLVNAARGPIVDQAALTRALQERRIAGAALDVFDPEPPDPSDPLLALDSVIATAHAIAWTTESLYECSLEACRAIASVYSGSEPAYVANPDVLRRTRLRAKIEARRRTA